LWDDFGLVVYCVVFFFYLYCALLLDAREMG